MKANEWTMAGTALARARERDVDFPALPSRWRGPPTLPAPALEVVDEGPRLLHLAWELARLCPAEVEREALLHLAFALLVTAQKGSTSLRRRDDELAVLEAQIALGQPSVAAHALIVGMLRRGEIPPALAGFVGATGDPPVVLDDELVALHRFDRMERRLSSALAGQIGRDGLEVDDAAFGRALEEVRGSAASPWTSEQQLALLHAVHQPFTVIAGGPGTGKTTIVVSLLRLLARLGVPPGNIALAAPTGKAAHRMVEVVREQLARCASPADEALGASLPEPRTLHRLLGYSPSQDRFRHDEHDPLEQDLVIVDECSMVDIALMDQLLRACAPRAPSAPPRRLVLLGDGHQLPSVEAGMVLQHLTEPNGASRVVKLPHRAWFRHLRVGPDDPPLPIAAAPSESGDDDPRARFLVTLTKSHRMNPARPNGKRIYEYARAILEGTVDALGPSADATPIARARAEDLAFAGVEHLAASLAEQPPAELFARWWARGFEGSVRVGELAWKVPELHEHVFRFDDGALLEEDRAPFAALMKTAESQRILCLTRGTSPSGAERANRWFADHRASLREQAPKAMRHQRSYGLYPGDPVLFVKNDYTLKLFNGDFGVVAWTKIGRGERRLRAVFPRASGPAAYELEAVRDRLQRAYALTVHKAQGSQVEFAALLLPEEASSPLLVQQLVYTAVSRASDSVVLVGNLDRVADAAKNPVHRTSALVDRTRRALAAAGDLRGPSPA